MMHLHKLGFGGCLADDMGLGKTLQTLTLLQHIYKSPASRKAATLIVVPTSLLHNWRREAKRFTTLSMIEYNSSIVVPPNHPGKFFGRPVDIHNVWHDAQQHRPAFFLQIRIYRTR